MAAIGSTWPHSQTLTRCDSEKCGDDEIEMVEANTAVGELNYLLAAERFDEAPTYAVIRHSPIDEPEKEIEQKAELISTESSVKRFRLFNASRSKTQQDQPEKRKKNLSSSKQENRRSMSASRRSLSESRRSLSASWRSMSASRRSRKTESVKKPKKLKNEQSRSPTRKSSKKSTDAAKKQGKLLNRLKKSEKASSSKHIDSDTKNILQDLDKNSTTPISLPRGRSKICRETIENVLRDDGLGEMQESATKYRERSIRLLNSIDPSILKTITSDPFMKTWPIESRRAAKKAFLYAAEARRLTDLVEAMVSNTTPPRSPGRSILRESSLDKPKSFSSRGSRVKFEIPEDDSDNNTLCSRTRSVESHTTHTTYTTWSDSSRTTSTKGNSSTFTSHVEKEAENCDDELDETLGKQYVKETLKIMQSFSEDHTQAIPLPDPQFFSEDNTRVVPPPGLQRGKPRKLPNHLVQRWKNAVNNVNTLMVVNEGDLSEHEPQHACTESNSGSAHSSQAIDGRNSEIQQMVIREVIANLSLENRPKLIETRAMGANPPGLVASDLIDGIQIVGESANDEESVIFQSEAGISQCTPKFRNY